MPGINRLLRRDVLISIPIVGGLLAFVSSVLGQESNAASLAATPPDGASEDNSLTLKSLQEELRELQSRLEETDSQVSRLSQFDSPVGSVLGYLGPIPDDEAARWEWERRIGWLVCDGRPLDTKPEFQELKKVLGLTHLPDLRGRFLRGVDVPAGGKLADIDEEKSRPVGTLQGYATARPTARDGIDVRFLTNEIPEIDLTSRGKSRMGLDEHFNCLMALSSGQGPDTGVNTDQSKDEPDLYRALPIKPVPKHSHSIDSGGNHETRPYNVTVYWIIKVSARELPR